MDKITKRCAAALICGLLVCLCAVNISAAGAGRGLLDLPRSAESVVDDITGAISDAIGEVTGNNPADTAEGTNIPQDSSGMVTDTDPVTDPVTTDRTTTDRTTTDNVTTNPDTTGNTAEDGKGSGFIGIVIAIIAAIAVVLLIIALMPRKKND